MLWLKVLLVLMGIMGVIVVDGYYYNSGRYRHVYYCGIRKCVVKKNPPGCKKWCPVVVSDGHCNRVRYQCCSFKEKPGYCPTDQQHCKCPIPYYFTQAYRCRHDYNCPLGYKCCQDSCYAHRVCKPCVSTAYPEVTTTQTHPKETDVNVVLTITTTTDKNYVSTTNKIHTDDNTMSSKDITTTTKGTTENDLITNIEETTREAVSTSTTKIAQSTDITTSNKETIMTLMTTQMPVSTPSTPKETETTLSSTVDEATTTTSTQLTTQTPTDTPSTVKITQTTLSSAAEETTVALTTEPSSTFTSTEKTETTTIPNKDETSTAATIDSSVETTPSQLATSTISGVEGNDGEDVSGSGDIEFPEPEASKLILRSDDEDYSDYYYV